MPKTFKQIRDCIFSKNERIAWYRLIVRNIADLRKYGLEIPQIINQESETQVPEDLAKLLYQDYCKLYPNEAASHADCFFS